LLLIHIIYFNLKTCYKRIINKILKELIIPATTITAIIISVATVCYAFFSGFTLKKLYDQNNLLTLEIHNKLASFLRDEWKNAGFNKIVGKVKNYSSYSFIKSFKIDRKKSTKKQIEFYDNIELLTIDQLDRVIGLTRKINGYIDKKQLNIDTVLLYFEYLYGDTEWSCDENYNIIIYCLTELYKNVNPKNLVIEKIKVIDNFYTKVSNSRKYKKLNTSILRKKNLS